MASQKTLRIAKDLELPLEAVVQTLAAIGRKGAGKTYLATMIAEQMLDAGAQVVALDPVGNWYGLRVAADGKSPGKSIFVLGGAEGDVPLTPESGAKIARLIVERSISAVLDVSAFRQGERKRFAADFGEELFHLKKTSRTAVHLFVEEAQLFAPQRPGPDDARMLGAFEHLVRLGRNYGIGCTLVTQRPQSVNKEVLSQVECLCVLQVNGTHERKALEEWVQERGADRKLIGELPGLAQGEGFVWSPSWLRTFRRVRFAKKETFDASATPEVGKAARAAKLSAVDVAELREQMAEIVEKAQADDPVALRKELAAARKLLEEQAAAVERAEKRAAGRAELEANLVAAEAKIAELEIAVGLQRPLPVELLEEIDAVLRAVDRLGTLGASLAHGAKTERTPPYVRGRRFLSDDPQAKRAAESLIDRGLAAGDPAAAHSLAILRDSAPCEGFATKLRSVRLELASDAKIGAGERRVLTAIAQHRDGVDRAQLTILTGYKRSSRDTYLQRLRSAGMIADVGDDRIGATPNGIAALGEDFEPLPRGAALRAYWLDKLGVGGEARILEILFDAFPAGIARERISHLTGYKRSSRDTYLQRLAARKLVVSQPGGVVSANRELFS